MRIYCSLSHVLLISPQPPLHPSLHPSLHPPCTSPAPTLHPSLHFPCTSPTPPLQPLHLLRKTLDCPRSAITMNTAAFLCYHRGHLSVLSLPRSLSHVAEAHRYPFTHSEIGSRGPGAWPGVGRATYHFASRTKEADYRRALATR